MQTARRIGVRPNRDELIAQIEAAGTLREAARQLGVSRQTLWRWTREFEIKVRPAIKAA